MIEAAKAACGELILVILGPLTNVALACKLDPQLPSRGQALRILLILCLTLMLLLLRLQRSSQAKEAHKVTLHYSNLGTCL